MTIYIDIDIEIDVDINKYMILNVTTRQKVSQQNFIKFLKIMSIQYILRYCRWKKSCTT